MSVKEQQKHLKKKLAELGMEGRLVSSVLFACFRALNEIPAEYGESERDQIEA